MADTDVQMYSKGWCPFCSAAKSLLQTKGVHFEEIDIANEPTRRAEMETRSGGRRTVPQIFIGERHVGGYDELAALDRAGQLDPLLAGLGPIDSSQPQSNS